MPPPPRSSKWFMAWISSSSLSDEQVLPDGIVSLDQVQVHAVEKVLLPLQQGVGLGQKGPHQRTGGGIAGVDDQGQFLDLFAFPAFPAAR